LPQTSYSLRYSGVGLPRESASFSSSGHAQTRSVIADLSKRFGAVLPEKVNVTGAERGFVALLMSDLMY
jgi:hypothetical protein